MQATSTTASICGNYIRITVPAGNSNAGFPEPGRKKLTSGNRMKYAGFLLKKEFAYE